MALYPDMATSYKNISAKGEIKYSLISSPPLYPQNKINN